MNWKYRLLYLAARCYWRIFRPITLGVKLLLVKDDTIWLVQHSYQHGWFLPGGGVKRNEVLETAVRREAREELGAELGEVRVFGVYSSISEYKNDHVVVFYCHNFMAAVLVYNFRSLAAQFVILCCSAFLRHCIPAQFSD